MSLILINCQLQRRRYIRYEYSLKLGKYTLYSKNNPIKQRTPISLNVFRTLLLLYLLLPTPAVAPNDSYYLGCPLVTPHHLLSGRDCHTFVTLTLNCPSVHQFSHTICSHPSCIILVLASSIIRCQNRIKHVSYVSIYNSRTTPCQCCIYLALKEPTCDMTLPFCLDNKQVQAEIILLKLINLVKRT